MAWRDWFFPLKTQTIEALTADATIVQPAPARDDAPQRRQLWQQSNEWQREVWDFYDSLGEFRQGVQWKANMLSRVRLVAARRRPGYEDPEVVTTGPAADLIAELAGGLGGQSALMASFSTYFDVPGECYLVGETLNSGVNKWYVRAMEEIRRQLNGDGYQVRDDGGKWRDLPDDSMVVRAWRPHRRNHTVADSPARPARTLMRELELLNRHIQSQYMSRLASAGVILFPDEVTFPTRPEFADEPDPFVAEWIEIAAEAIRTPGTAAAVVPIPIKVPGEYVDKVRHIDFTLKLDDKIVEKRDSALTRLAIMLDMPPEALLGTSGVNHWCTDIETKIYTRERGWVAHDELFVGDVVLTLNHETGLSEWQPVLDIARFDVADLPMRSVEGRSHSSLTTAAHRWPVVRKVMNATNRTVGWTREWVTSETMQRHDNIITSAPHSDLPVEPKWTDAFVELVAWYFTEGTIRKSQFASQVLIGQSHRANPDKVARIRRTLTELYGPECVGRIPSKQGTAPTWKTSSFGAYGVTMFNLSRAAAQQLLDAAPDRVVPRSFIEQLTRAQLELFITVAGLADGHVRGDAITVQQRDPRLLDAVAHAAVLLGRQVHIYTYVGGAYKPGLMHGISIYADRTSVNPWCMGKHRSRYEGVTTQRYTGVVWCPVTLNGTWFAQRHGQTYFTGNSAWLIDEQGVKIHVSPTVELVCDALTTGYLTPRLLADDEDPDEWLVWYDASNLILRPDRSQDATDTYDRLELSGEALRREHGFDESDKPNDDELRTIILKKAALQPVNTFAAMDELGLKTDHDTPPTEPRPPGEPADTQDKRVEPGPPDNAPPLQPEKATSQVEIARILTHQAGLMHALNITVRGTEVKTDVFHPKDCEKHLFSCPVTHALWKPQLGALPGRQGTYKCWLNAYGQPIVGDRVAADLTRDMISSAAVRSFNGVTH
jgi:hypothetical protein